MAHLTYDIYSSYSSNFINDTFNTTSQETFPTDETDDIILSTTPSTGIRSALSTAHTMFSQNETLEILHTNADTIQPYTTPIDSLTSDLYTHSTHLINDNHNTSSHTNKYSTDQAQKYSLPTTDYEVLKLIQTNPYYTISENHILDSNMENNRSDNIQPYTTIMTTLSSGPQSSSPNLSRPTTIHNSLLTVPMNTNMLSTASQTSTASFQTSADRVFEISTFDSIMNTNSNITQPLTTIMTSPTPDLYSPSANLSNVNDYSQNINMTHQEIKEYLEHLQNEEFQVYITALVFIIILAVVGLFGNILVLIVYNSKSRRTPTRIFIMTIAVLDLVSNVVSIPGDTYEMFHLWNHSIPEMCSLIRYAKGSPTITAALVLLALSVTRYKKICRPFGKQVTTHQAKITCASLALFGVIVCIPYAIMHGLHSRPTPRAGIVGYMCDIKDEYLETVWPLVNNAFFLLLFVSMSIPLGTMCTLIGIQAFKHSTAYGQSNMNIKSTVSKEMSRGTLSKSVDDIDDRPNERMLVDRVALNKHSKYSKTNQSNILDLHTSYASGINDSIGREIPETNEFIVMAELKATPADSRKESTHYVEMVRSLNDEKAVVHFSMVREPTVKLKEIKQCDGTFSSSSDKETPTSPKESDGGDDGMVAGSNVSSDKETPTSPKRRGDVGIMAGSNSGPANSNIETDFETSETTHDENKEDIESNDQHCDSIIRAARPQEAEALNIQSRDSGNKGDTFISLNWIDAANSFHEDDNKKRGDEDLTRKESRGNSLLRKHQNIREKLKRGGQSVKDTDQDVDDDFGAETNTTAEREVEESEETNTLQPHKRRRNVQINVQEVKVTMKQNYQRRKDGRKQYLTSQRTQGAMSKATAILILITFVFILSLFPYLVVKFYRFTQPESFKAMGKPAQTAHHLFHRTYLINSAANAIIYSLCDRNFRKEALKLFTWKK